MAQNERYLEINTDLSPLGERAYSSEDKVRGLVERPEIERTKRATFVPNPSVKAQYQPISFRLNGEDVSCMVDVRKSLLEMLREDFGLTSVKKGCEVGECGACSVLVNGEVFDSCIYLAVWAEGREITTLEGLMGPGGELSDLQQAFIDEAAVQCGFCTPGMIMAAVPLVNAGKRYTREELRKLMAGNMCRCTGYENILKAIESVIERRLTIDET